MNHRRLRRKNVLWLPFLIATVLGEVGQVNSVQADQSSRADKLKVVVFGGHPDDPESVVGELIAWRTLDGHEVIAAYGTAFRGQRRFFDQPEADVRPSPKSQETFSMPPLHPCALLALALIFAAD